MVMMSGGRSQLLLLVLFVAVFYLLLQEETTTANDVIMCKESERQALLDFKQSLQVVDRADFEGLSSWDGKDCCAWMGVLCNSLTGYVEMLQLSGYFWLVAGCIPPSLSELTFLGSLDLSYNYLSGKIPTGSQLQLFDPSTFSHNHGLCGPPVTPNCSMETPQGQLERGEDDFDEFMKWFYAGMGLGFVVGFWGFCGAFLLKRSWRHSYFRFLDKVKDWLCVTYALQKARLERRIQT